MATIPQRVADRLRKHVRKYQRVLCNARDRDVHESDTVKIVTGILADVFGFDIWNEITGEYLIHGTYCDLATRKGDDIQYLIEVKAIGFKLNEKHLGKVVGYAVKAGVEWGVLTNGILWELYHIQFDKPVDWELVARFNFPEMNPRKQDDRELLFLLCKEGETARTQAGENREVMNRHVIGAAILSKPVVSAIRRILHYMVDKTLDPDKVRTILENGVLKRDAIEGEEAKKAKAKVTKALKKTPKKRKK